MLVGNIFILLTSPLHQQTCPAAACSCWEAAGLDGGVAESSRCWSSGSCPGSPTAFYGQPQEQLLPYFISTDLNEFSKGTKSRLRLQLQLKPPVLRWKRFQTAPLPHLSKGHHKLSEILLQTKPTDL